MKLSELKAYIYQRDNQLPDVDDGTFQGLLDRAIANVRGALMEFDSNAFHAQLSSQTAPVAFPDDLVQDEQTLFYQEGSDIIVSDDFINERLGVWSFNGTLDIVYPKNIARFSSMETVLPFKNRKSEEILISEMLALINLSYEQNENTAAVSNSISQSNRVN